MSVINQMLRELELRGATPPQVAAAGTATVARPPLPRTERRAPRTRRWVWTGVLAVSATLIGVHAWLDLRVQQAQTPPAPLGTRQFGALVAAEAQAAPAAPAAAAPAQAPAPVEQPAAQAPATAARSAPPPPSPKQPARPRAATLAAAPRTTAAPVDPASPAYSAAPARAADTPAAPAAAALVVRPANDVALDLERAADLIARGRSSEAIALLRQVLVRNAAHAGARTTLAALLAESGQREAALHVLLAGVEADAVRFAPLAARLQAELDDVPGALQTLARVPAAGRSAGHEALFAGLSQRAGDHDAAIAAYRRALSQPRPQAVWWVGLGLSLEARQQPAEARTAFTRAAADPALPADVRRYVTERLAALEAHAASADQTRRASLANVF
jgi:MSHA biogenesis protein MshN